jgi:sulfhydrogenase subunit beta (sulfur reductase)
MSKNTVARELIVLERRDFPKLLQGLVRKGYQLFGPTIDNGALVYGELSSEADLPIGWGDEQEAGTFRLRKRDDEALFGYSVGQHSWKQFLLPPRTRMWHAEMGEDRFHSFHLLPQGAESSVSPFAFVGVRPCDLHAIAIQDKICMDERYPDSEYVMRRKDNFIVAINCSQACGTCFCASMGTGPRASTGFDLALTEILEKDRHYFGVEVGSGRGQELMSEIRYRQAQAEEKGAVNRILARTAGQMGRTLDTAGIKELLYRNLEHPRWDEVALRCLSCANCTLVCPTCFCVEVEDFTSLDGKSAERVRSWYSCFTMDHSYIHGGAIRKTIKSRYRQWMTHKLATWIDQFGMSGCVGCGRCITWCPVGIDITEETSVIRRSEREGEGGIRAKG